MNSYPNLADRFSNATEINLTIDKCDLQERIKRVCALAVGSARNIKYKEACFYVSSLRTMAQEKFISPTYPGSSYSFPHDERKKRTGKWTLCFLATVRSVKRRNVRKVGETSPFRSGAGQGNRVANIFDWKHRRNGVYVSCRWTSYDWMDCIENSFNRIYVCIYIYVHYCTCM